MSEASVPSLLQRGIAALWLMAIGLVWALVILPAGAIALAVSLSPRRRD